MDCVRTAIRQGAKSVTCLYRRDRANMPGSAREVKNAEEEGVVFNWLSAPKNLVLEKGKITGLRVAKMRLTEADGSGPVSYTHLDVYKRQMRYHAKGVKPFWVT